MRRPLGIGLVLALLSLTDTAHAQARSEPSTGVHLLAYAGYSTYVDVMGYLSGIYLERREATVSPVGPGLAVLWDWRRGDELSPLVVGGRLQSFFGQSGAGFEVVLHAGLVLVRRRLFELFLLPGVGLASFTDETGITAWTGTNRGPLFSLGLAATVASYHRLELFVLATFDVLPVQPYPFVGVGLDGVLGIGVGYRP